ncbi:uncharacterized protein B0P05DRAFT_532044 [Gilbertella persicaria]|uniref:uncharacterized protein n=1 Tax=Gilbertella persicaria TaxID=101096 RepID=UPI00221FDE2D|nr:uncharacterized protein B0P05DRAFT_532044 [Gilbertella persicaria]KAI8087727.1 hypothetical protein B0P05DRAFT_532044 [Gilbertella persicaria]
MIDHTEHQKQIIPSFHFPNGKPLKKEHKEMLLKIMVKVKDIYENQSCLSEAQFLPVTRACGLPRYMNMAFFRRLQSFSKTSSPKLAFSVFVEGWASIVLKRHNHSQHDDKSLYFNILKKTNSQWIVPGDFLPVLEDVVRNHPGLQFLVNNPMFQERYIETVICTIFYEAKCANGKMRLSDFYKSNFVQTIKQLGPKIDLNSTRDCFSYKHFYVLYVKFWELDGDHDLIIFEHDLANYNDGILSSKLVHQIMQHGRIPAFTARKNQQKDHLTLTYLDYIWFLLSEVDKSTPSAIEYWFQCMDDDGDGIITSFDLAEHWSEQDKKLQEAIEFYYEDPIRLEDLICQMNDLIQPKIPGQFTLSDLKKNGIMAERFFDTFFNIQKFQIHDTYQGLIRANEQLEKERKRQYELEKRRFMEFKRFHMLVGDSSVWKEHFLESFSLGVWSDYAEQEYEILLLKEQFDEEEEEEDEDKSVESDWSPRNLLEDEGHDEGQVAKENLIEMLLASNNKNTNNSQANSDTTITSLMQTMNEYNADINSRIRNNNRIWHSVV